MDEPFAASPIAGDANDPILVDNPTTQSVTQMTSQFEEAAQDAADLAAFTAWVTLKLVSRRHSIIAKSKMTASTWNRFRPANCHNSHQILKCKSLHSNPATHTESDVVRHSFHGSAEIQSNWSPIFLVNFCDTGLNSVPSLSMSSSVGSASSIYIDGYSKSPSLGPQLPPLSSILCQFMPASAKVRQIVCSSRSASPKELPTAYAAHYTSRLTRLATLTVLRLPTPPHTLLIALHLLRRIMSAPRMLPDSLATPTRLLLACLIAADTVIGSERGVTTREWSVIARTCGIYGDDAGGINLGSGSSTANLVVNLKREVLQSLDYSLQESLWVYREWVDTLCDLLQRDDVSDHSSFSSATDMRLRTQLILKELGTGDRVLDMGWKW
ncbi:hypothetical protein HDU82_004671 [Entophlyctis luteolus]|nr:hypothetical protein HDU82_004671 [Entophlyctis luteolus]